MIMHWFRKIKVSALLAVAAPFSGGAQVYAFARGDNGDNAFVLVVDPGHGGHDAGAVDHGQKEKDINLAVGRALSELVKKKLKDVKVVMTRDDDTYLTLQQRADKANKSKGDLFVSIHTNSVDKSNKNRRNVSGTSVYTLGLHKDNNNMEVARRENSVIELESNYEQRYSGFDPAKDESYIIFEMAQKKNLHNSIRFAREAQRNLVSHAGRRDRGVHQAGFWVLWATSMPSVLVELDFVCNPDQAAYLGSDKGVKQLSEALFEAVKKYVETNGDNLPKGKRAEQRAEAEPEPAVESGSAAVLLADAAPVARTEAPVASTSRRQDYAQRRRRSAAARHKSESRNVEVADIPLHSSSERLAVPQSDTYSTASEPKLSPKEQAKREKEARKAAEKARKEAKKEAEKARKLAEKKAKAERKASKAKKVQHFRTVYKIQILASKDILKQGNPRFKGLAPITMFRENNLYKYTYGECETKQEADALLKQVKTKIPDAFVIETTRQRK